MHPELEAEQAYVDKAYFYLESARLRALDLTDMVEVGRGGTNQACLLYTSPSPRDRG